MEQFSGEIQPLVVKVSITKTNTSTVSHIEGEKLLKISGGKSFTSKIYFGKKVLKISLTKNVFLQTTFFSVSVCFSNTQFDDFLFFTWFQTKKNSYGFKL